MEVVAIDALPFNVFGEQFRGKEIDRELNKVNNGIIFHIFPDLLFISF